MKILFIYSVDDIQSIKHPLSSWSFVQFGISYVSSVLKSGGHRTRLLVLGSNYPERSMRMVESAVSDFSPEVVCFTAVYSQYSFIVKIAELTASLNPDIYLLLGGVHATLSPDEAFNGPFDAVCVGEGEFPALELCNQLEFGKLPSQIPNLWIKRPGGSIEKNDTRSFFQNLDALTFPDRDMWKPWIHPQINDEIGILLGRGCPYNCTYCSNHALKKVAPDRYVRFRSAENIIKEVSFVHANFPRRRIYFEVETVDVNKDWMIHLCSLLAPYNSSINNSITYGCNLRVSRHTADKKLFVALKQANFSKINIGLESGSERIRRDVLNRNYSNEDFLRVVELARNSDLKVYVFNMIGLPMESLEEHNETVRLNRQVQPDSHYTGIFYPYPGTALYELCLHQGLIKGELNSSMERRQPVIELPDFTTRQVKSAHTWFNKNIT